jgi:hypothetical protein
MDITISPSNLKRFTSSISCLGKIGKDLYVSFDPFDGLTLSSLNEAKSAFGKFHFEPGFFEKCGAATSAASAGGGAGAGEAPWRNRNVSNNASRGSNHRSGNNSRTNDSNDDENDDTNDNDNAGKDARYVCRVPIRSIHSILRPRKGVISLRIRSEGMDAAGNYFGLNRMKQHAGNGGGGGGNNGIRGRDRHGHCRRREGRSRSRSRDYDDEEEDDEDNRRGMRSGSFSARQRSRSRRRRKQQSRNPGEDHNHSDDDENNDDGNGISHNTEKMMLSFEYFIECLQSKNDMQSNHHNHPNNSNNNGSGGGTFRILHKVGVTDCNGISLSESISQRRTRSEIISHPRLWLRLIDPLRRTPEMALTIDDQLKVVTATSFHPMEVVQNGGGNDNAILQAAIARNAVLKTETSMGADEFDEFDFRNNRGKERKRQSRKGRDGDSDEESGDNFGDDETNEDEGGGERDTPPSDVNQKVILVFSIKEAKVRIHNFHR